MYITQQDIINMRLAANAGLGTGEIIKDILDGLVTDEKYERAQDGERYYAGEHDIEDKDFRAETIEETETYLDDNGETQERLVQKIFENPNRSNEKTIHPFFHNHVEQKVSYILGKEPSISVKGAPDEAEAKAYQEALAATTDAHFAEALASLATAASKHGKAWLHEYKDRQGRLRQVVVDRLHAAPIYDAAHEKQLEEMIYFYDTTVRISRGSPIKRRVAEWWTAKDVSYWISDSGAPFVPDPQRPGSQPHFWEVTTVTGPDGVTPVEKSRRPMSWGRVPFVELANNDEGSTDLERYKGLIDAYDLISSTGTNNLLDFNEFWMVLQGYGGDTASAVARKLRINRAVSISGQNGNIEMQQLSLDMEGRIKWLKELRDAIHEFGMAVDINPDRIGNAPSGVSLKFQYTLLDLKANRIIAKLRQAIKDHFWFVTQEINRKSGTQYDSQLVTATFNKSMITNDTELVSMIVASQDIVPESILLAAHPLVEDPDAAMTEMQKQRKRKAAEARAAFGGDFGRVQQGDE